MSLRSSRRNHVANPSSGQVDAGRDSGGARGAPRSAGTASGTARGAPRSAGTASGTARGVPRPAGTASGREGGSALVEFTFLGVVVLVPLVYLVVLVARVQAATFAVTVAAREAARAFVTTSAGGVPEARARVAADLAFSDQGFDTEGLLEVRCSASPCLAPKTQVHVRAALTVTLPGAAGLGGAASAWPRIPVEFTHVATVDRFRPR